MAQVPDEENQALLSPTDGEDGEPKVDSRAQESDAHTMSAAQWCSNHKYVCLALLIMVIVAASIAIPVIVVKRSSYIGGDPLSNFQDAFTQGAFLCSNSRNNTLRVSVANVDNSITSPTYLIKNALVIWDGLGNDYNNADILLYNGSVRQIGSNIPQPSDAIVIDATGKYITPGLVDMHSHVGVYAQPELNGNSDGNEATNPVFPQVRAIDAYNPFDESINLILRGGVTTSLVLPGSANTMGGEAFVVKHRGSTVAAAAISDAPRYIKMACGENPKNVYGPRGITPASRMGSAWVMRARLEAAQKLATQQDDWCSTPSTTNRYPLDLSLDSLVALLRGSLLLNVHCYTVWDMEMMIRLSKEFNFKIAAFHHAIEAWKLAETLAAENITTATFADHWGFKHEGYDSSVYAPQILAAANAKVVIKSDHPVLVADTLMFEAAKTVTYGFDPHSALAAVTSVPAESLALANRIGSLKVGADADVVIWDRSPFILGAQADKIFVDGSLVVNNELNVNTDPVASATPSLVVPPGTTCTSTASSVFDSYRVTNVTVYTGSGTSNGLVVVGGNVTCLGDATACAGSFIEFNMQGGQIVPGLINIGNNLGLAEIEQEDVTQDGSAQDSWTNMAGLRAIDGVQFFNQGKLIRAAFVGGVTLTVTAPIGSRLVVGQSAAFLTGLGTVVDDVLIKEVTALHVNLGQTAKVSGTGTGSISGQIATLRTLFLEATVNGTDAISQVVSGSLPLVITANNADTMASALRLLADFPLLRLVFYGGQEAHLIAQKLANANAAVILKGVHCFPRLWESQRCPPNDNTATILVNAGVTVAIAAQSIDWVRNLRWEAGLARARGLTFEQALATVTTTPAAIFGLRNYGTITVNSPANFVGFNGDPLSLQSVPQLIGIGNQVVCYPRQQ